jgi:hypothetical protein
MFGSKISTQKHTGKQAGQAVVPHSTLGIVVSHFGSHTLILGPSRADFYNNCVAWPGKGSFIPRP